MVDSELDSKINDALNQLKKEITQDIIDRMQTPSTTSTRYKLTIYLMILTGTITLGVMAMSALRIPVPEIATGVILMGIFQTLMQALNSYFEARKEVALAKLQ